MTGVVHMFKVVPMGYLEHGKPVKKHSVQDRDLSNVGTRRRA